MACLKVSEELTTKREILCYWKLDQHLWKALNLSGEKKKPPQQKKKKQTKPNKLFPKSRACMTFWSNWHLGAIKGADVPLWACVSPQLSLFGCIFKAFSNRMSLTAGREIDYSSLRRILNLLAGDFGCSSPRWQMFDGPVLAKGPGLPCLPMTNVPLWSACSGVTEDFNWGRGGKGEKWKEAGTILSALQPCLSRIHSEGQKGMWPHSFAILMR